jgi:hypothetical protein
MATLIHPPVPYPATNINFACANDVGQRVLLPAWGTFFIDMGRRVAQSESGQNRLVVGLAVPTRAFAAALAAFGVVLARANSSMKQVDPSTHFERLCGLPKRTPVVFREKGKQFKGIYEGIKKEHDKQYLQIRVESQNTGGLTYLVLPEECHNVAEASEQISELPDRQKGRPIIYNRKFLESLIGEEDVFKFATSSCLECTILGRISILRHEIKEINFYCGQDKGVYKAGKLQDILRVREWLSKDEAYRSEVLPVDGHNQQKTAEGLVPHVTIFDGAAGFLKWRDYWRNSHWIIVLDRTEPHFREAVELVNQDYIQNRVGEGGIQNMPPSPPGVEFVVYQEARQ